MQSQNKPPVRVTDNPYDQLCLICGAVGIPFHKANSSGRLAVLFLVLWILSSLASVGLGLIFFILFIVFLIIKLVSAPKIICVQCGHSNIIPIHTPVAQSLLKSSDFQK